jgi:predicted NAD/FAD-dependent oxidoreductase
MSALGRGLADDLDLRPGVRVRLPVRTNRAWQLIDDAGGDLGTFDRVLVSAPAPQAAALLQAVPVLAERAGAVPFLPTWSVLLDFNEPPGLRWDGLFVNGGPLRWIASNGSKPGRSGDRWVLLATPEWSQAHLEDHPDRVAALLTDAFAEIAVTAAAFLPAPLASRAHRWRYALAPAPLAEGCLWEPALGIGACGDWCLDGRIEGAWLSGEALAGRVLADLARPRGRNGRSG